MTKLIVLMIFLFGMSVPTWAQQPDARPPEPEIYQGFDSLIPGLPPEIVRVSFGKQKAHKLPAELASAASPTANAIDIDELPVTAQTAVDTTTISFKIPTVRLQLVLDAFDYAYPGRTGRVDAQGNPLPDIKKGPWFRRHLRSFVATIVDDFVKNGDPNLKTLKAQKEAEAESIKTEIEREQ